MNAESSSNLAPGKAWRSVRLEALALAVGLMVGGAALILISLPHPQGMLLQIIGIVLIIVGAFIVAVRPWNFMKRMEIQMRTQKDSLESSQAKRGQYGQADLHWHPEGEERHHPGVCGVGAMPRGGEGKFRSNDEERD